MINDEQMTHQMCRTSPSLQSALEIGRKGELYAFEKSHKIALENLAVSLGLLIPLIQQEPPGPRRDMLHFITSKWMVEAERLKKDIEKEDLDNATEVPSQHSCCIQ
ncbi:hypothetical protein Bhyg_10569 [Pseudolycoriella hygida]|uniref:Uncharacterized protein n=1 Tax=Pseudolycoriella hygida TaxID=35572 RepID=A0A9Q0MTU6_9DIPT|nr:hypothetical protein Bhyg_10569 [Pseudolycoriella hygida]